MLAKYGLNRGVMDNEMLAKYSPNKGVTGHNRSAKENPNIDVFRAIKGWPKGNPKVVALLSIMGSPKLILLGQLHAMMG